MGRYCSDDKVLSRLRGKVRLTDTPDAEPDRMDVTLFKDLVDEAEAQVELDLSERYFVPLQTIEGAVFGSLPERTRRLLNVAAELQSAIRVLETDFGDGGPSDASKYSGALAARYKALISQLLEKRDGLSGGTFQWRYPPLPGLKLAAHNSQVDDGFAGHIQVSSQEDGRGDFPRKQIDDPSEQFFGGTIDP